MYWKTAVWEFCDPFFFYFFGFWAYCCIFGIISAYQPANEYLDKVGAKSNCYYGYNDSLLQSYPVAGFHFSLLRLRVSKHAAFALFLHPYLNCNLLTFNLLTNDQNSSWSYIVCIVHMNEAVTEKLIIQGYRFL